MPVDLELDGIVCDILERIVEGIEPFVRPEFEGLPVPARDLSIAIDITFDHLLTANAEKTGLSARERARRKRDLEKTSLELRRLPFRLADTDGLITLSQA